jgi:hypothetical protein
MTLEALSRPSCTYGVVGAPTPKNLRPSINLNANAGNQGYNVQAGAGFSNNRASIGVNAGDIKVTMSEILLNRMKLLFSK